MTTIRRTAVVTGVEAALLRAGAAPAMAESTCSDIEALDIAVHGQHVVRDYVSGGGPAPPGHPKAACAPSAVRSCLADPGRASTSRMGSHPARRSACRSPALPDSTSAAEEQGYGPSWIDDRTQTVVKAQRPSGTRNGAGSQTGARPVRRTGVAAVRLPGTGGDFDRQP